MMVTECINAKLVDFDPFESEKEIEKIVVINESQREIWLSCTIGGDAASLAYNESVSLKLTGDFSFDLFKQSFNNVVQRHEALRSTISANGEHFIIYKSLGFDFELINLSSLNVAQQNEAMSTFLETQMLTTIDLQEGPLFRVFVHQLNNNEHHFTIVMHHIICDGWSTGIILENLSTTYNALKKGLSANLPPVVQISDYATQQTQFSGSEEFKETAQYWLNLYQNDIPILNLPIDFDRGRHRTYQAKRKDYAISANLVSKLKETGSKAGCSLVNTMLSLFEIFLSQQTKQSDIVVGLPAAGQLATANQELVGHCVNILPIRSKIDKSQSFLAYLKQSKGVFLDAFEHQLFSFGQLLKNLNFKRDSARVPLVPVIFNIDMGMDGGVSFDGLSYQLKSNPRAYETFELFLNISGTENALVLEWTYNTQLFKDTSIDRMFSEFEAILNNFVKDPNDTISQSEIDIFTNPTIASSMGQNITKKETFIDLLQLSAGQFAQKTAVGFKDETFSYKEIETLSNSLASFLISEGVKKGDIVAIATERSAKMLISLLAIMKAGAAYLPLDPEYPKDRIEFMMEDAGAKTLLVSRKYHQSFQTTAKKLVIEDICSLLNPQTSKIIEVNEDDLAYILYTSGSTGKPKGVQITHKNLANFLTSMQQAPGVADSDMLLAITTISFDIAGLELFLPLLSGAELYIADSESIKDGRLLLAILEEKPITIMQATPSTWQMLLDSGWKKPLPLKILCGGEALSKDLSEKLLNLSNELWNMYGPTETTIWSTIKHVLPNNEVLTIGSAIQNTQIFILNEQNQPLAVNEIGEICIGGDGVAKGYLNRSELTAEKFIKHFDNNSEGKIYKTGDLGKILSNGEIVCLGRIDQQVKIRGHRIELGEIEALIAKQKEVKQTVVTTHEIKPGDTRIIAYVTLSDDSENIKFDTLDELDQNVGLKIIARENTIVWKEQLYEHLPTYMVPDYYFAIKSFPLTPNSKIDRKSLPAPKFVKANYSPAQALSLNEKIIAEIWTEVLGIQDLKPADDFFELGGHSLLAIKVMVAIEKKTGTRLPLAVLIHNSTIESLALQLQEENHTSKFKSLVPLKSSGNNPPLYIIHGTGMNVIGFRSLALELDENQSLYGLQAKGLNPEDEPLEDIEAIAAGYIEEILQSNPVGPYSLIGYSSGGLLALEMSVQLEKMGKQVSFLGLLDTYVKHNDLKDLMNEKDYLGVLSFLAKSIHQYVAYVAKSPLTRAKSFTSNKILNKSNRHSVKLDKNDPQYVLDKLEKAHARAFKKYKFKKYTSPVHLFKANDPSGKYIRFADTNGLEPYIEKIKVINIPLGHLQFFKLPFVKTFAAELKKALYISTLILNVIPL